MFVNWLNTEVIVYVHVYSLSMCNQATFKLAKKALIDVQTRDRSGAANNAVVQQYADQLKEIHRYNFSGRDIHWLIWANAILSAEAHHREAMLNEPPPGKIIEFFTRAPDHSDNVLRGVQQNVSIGISFNHAAKESLRQMKSEMDELEDLIGKVTQQFKNLKCKFTLFENSVESNENLLNGIANAVNVTENEVSETAFQNIEYLEDPDHD